MTITDNGQLPAQATPPSSVGSSEIIDGSIGVVDLGAGVQDEFVNETGDTMRGDLAFDAYKATFAHAAATGHILETKLAADAGLRYVLQPDGTQRWGDGTGPFDVSAQRGITLSQLGLILNGSLRTNALQVNTTLKKIGAGDVEIDTGNIEMSGSNDINNVRTTNSGRFVGGTQSGYSGGLYQGTNFGLSSIVIGARLFPFVNETVQLRGDGLRFGSGSADTDWRMRRVAPNVVRLDPGDNFQVQQDPTFDDDVVRKKYVDDELAAIETTNTQQYITANGTTAVSASARTVVVNQTVPGAATVQLPAAPAAGRRLDITKRSATGGGNGVTVDGNGKNINGAGSEPLNQQYDSLTLEYSADVGEWMIL